MERIMTNSALRLQAVSVALAIGVTAVFAQEPPPSAVPGDASEAYLIDRIKRYAEVTPVDLGLPRNQRILLQTVAKQQILEHVDTLIARYPESAFREEAVIIKLNALADLARLQSDYLDLLLSFTQQVAAGEPKGRLAAENAFASIRAFVLAARREGMPEDRRLLGTAERYVAFLADFPDSEHVPVVRASLIRNRIAQSRVDQAQEELAKLVRDYPDHQATRRAKGEVHRATAMGKPFAFAHTTPEGEAIRTKDCLGKVVLVHFWASWSEPSVESLPRLIELQERYASRGLQLIGVNVDANRASMEKVRKRYEMPWPLYFDAKGFDNAVFVEWGVRALPAYFLIDHEGILRSVDPGDALEETIQRLLAKVPGQRVPSGEADPGPGAGGDTGTEPPQGSGGSP
jgi:thiol-disulfide isomerase/thioredoxin